MGNCHRSLRLGVCAALAASPSYCWSFTGPDEFESAIATQESTLVAFVLPELEACKKLEPQWDILAQQHPRTAVVDCSAEAEYCLDQDVLTHPAIRLYFPDDTIERYRGPRKAESILSFIDRVQRRITPVAEDNSTSFLTSDDVAILAYIPPLSQENAALHETFENMAYRYRDRYRFGLFTSAESDPPRLVCRNNAGGFGLEAAGFSVPAVQSFLKGCGEPLVGELSRRNELSYMKSAKTMVHYFTDSEDDKKTYAELVQPVAQKYREYLNFLTVDIGEYPDMPTSVGHRRAASGVLALQSPRNWQAYPMPEGSKITAETVERFILDITEGKVSPWDGKPKVEEAVADNVHDEL